MVKFTLTGLRRLQAGIHNSSSMKDVYTQWGKRYLTFTKREFRKNSKGGGEWPPLKSISYRRAMGSNLLTTKSGRRRGAKRQASMKQRYAAARAKVKILIDTGTLFKALSIHMPGNLFRHITEGIRVGFAGVKGHKGTSLTIRAIAMKHQTGKGKLPKRKILHSPDAQLRTQMMMDLRRGIKKLMRGK